MNARFVAGFSAIVEDVAEARCFYGEKLSLPVKFDEGSDYSVVDLPGLKHFGLWTPRDAARSTFGRDEWPDHLNQTAGNARTGGGRRRRGGGRAQRQGLELLQDTRLEAWGQTTSRLLSPEGLLIGVVYTPMLREEESKS